MNKQSLIIFNLPILFDILNEIKENFKFDLYSFDEKEQINKLNEKNFGNYLVLTNLENLREQQKNQILIKKFPIKIDDLVEKVNKTEL